MPIARGGIMLGFEVSCGDVGGIFADSVFAVPAAVAALVSLVILSRVCHHKS